MPYCPCHHTIRKWKEAGIDPNMISDGGNPDCEECKTDPTGLYYDWDKKVEHLFKPVPIGHDEWDNLELVEDPFNLDNIKPPHPIEKGICEVCKEYKEVAWIESYHISGPELYSETYRCIECKPKE